MSHDKKLEAAYKSNDADEDLSSATETVSAGSELAGDIATLSVEPCETCQRADDVNSKQAKWFCRDCEESLCDECKGLHKRFKQTSNHTILSLQQSCGLCTQNSITCTAFVYCEDCKAFLCTECKSLHGKFPALKAHVMVKSQNKIKVKSCAPIKENTTGRPTTAAKYVNSDASGEMKSIINISVPPLTKAVKGQKVKHVGSINVQTSDDTEIPVISDALCVRDSTLLLVDFANRKLKHFDADFQFVQQTAFKNNPRRIAVNENNDIVMTMKESTILKLTMGAKIKENGVIKVNFDCCAIDFVNTNLLAVTGRSGDKDFAGCFCVFTIDGVEVTRMSADMTGSPLFSVPYYIKVDRERRRAYISNHGNDTVVALDLAANNDSLFQYRSEELLAPADISLDDKGSIYIVGVDSCNIHQVNQSGVNERILLGKGECMEAPRTISFYSSYDRFIVGGGSSKLKLSSGKNVHVYDLK